MYLLIGLPITFCMQKMLYHNIKQQLCGIARYACHKTTHCATKIPWLRDAIVSRENSIHKPCDDPIQQAVQYKHHEHMGHGKVVVYCHRTTYIMPVKANC